jgi:hypothetical protein
MSIFERLSKVNVNDHTEKKNGLTYLSWAWAWAEVKKAYPASYYTIYESQDGCLYHTDGRTCWVKTGVTIVDGDTALEHIEYLPVMDARNRSIPTKDVTSFDVNKAIQRSLTKACARHGLGLYIYAGEDLPEDEEPAAPRRSVTAEIARIKTKYGNDGFANMRQALIMGGVVQDIPSAQMTEADWFKLIDAIDSNFGEAA